MEKKLQSTHSHSTTNHYCSISLHNSSVLNSPTEVSSTIQQFNKIYNSLLHWLWTDIRIPKELKQLIADKNPQRALELGCGLGRFSSYIAQQRIQTIGVDFSDVAIQKAKKRVIDNMLKPTYIVNDVTDIKVLSIPFDISFDVGCFHCLPKEKTIKYVDEVYRLLKPTATHLLWTLDNAPKGIKITPEYITQIFGDRFQLIKSTFSRRRIISSHWYWLVRK